VSACAVNRIYFSGKQSAKIEYYNLQLSICILLKPEENVRGDNGKALLVLEEQSIKRDVDCGVRALEGLTKKKQVCDNR